MKVVIRESPSLVDYALLEFKGKFDPADPCDKELVPLGQLQKIDDKTFKLEIGIMDVVGTVQKLSQPMAVL